MISRLARVHHKFGFGASARMVIMLVGIVGMSIFGVIGFHSWWPTAIAIVGLIPGLKSFVRKSAAKSS